MKYLYRVKILNAFKKIDISVCYYFNKPPTKWEVIQQLQDNLIYGNLDYNKLDYYCISAV